MYNLVISREKSNLMFQIFSKLWAVLVLVDQGRPKKMHCLADVLKSTE